MKINYVKSQLSFVDAYSDNVKSIEKTYAAFLKEMVEVYGLDSLLDEEMLSLHTGIYIKAVSKAIKDFGLPDLTKHAKSLDITYAQRRKLELLSMYHKWMMTAIFKEKPVLNSSSKAGAFAITLFTDKAYEAFYLICLDAQSRLNYATLINEGTLNESPIYHVLLLKLLLHTVQIV